jgi:hypothetical protein
MGIFSVIVFLIPYNTNEKSVTLIFLLFFLEPLLGLWLWLYNKLFKCVSNCLHLSSPPLFLWELVVESAAPVAVFGM